MIITSECRYCKQKMQSSSVICISCFRERNRLCPYCRDAYGKLRMEFRDRRYAGKKIAADNCNKCNNTRWIFEEAKQ